MKRPIQINKWNVYSSQVPTNVSVKIQTNLHYNSPNVLFLK